LHPRYTIAAIERSQRAPPETGALKPNQSFRRGQPGSRPRLDLTWSRLEIAINGLAIAGLLVEIGVALWGFVALPARIPIHFNAAGEVDGWGGRGWLLALPAIAAATLVPLLFLQRFPHAYNYPWPITPDNAPRQYRLARLLLAGVALAAVAVIGIVMVSIVGAARGGSPRAWLFAVLLALPLLPLALYFPAARRAR
jgi:hypothetical protein